MSSWPRAIIDLSSFPVVGHSRAGAKRRRERRKRRRRIVIVGDDRAELYTSDAMANETRVKEETHQQLKSFWQTTMRRKVEVSNGRTTAEKRARDVLIKDAQSRAAPPQSS